MNVLDNSFKFTDHGQILVIFECDANNFLIKISDTGCGIAPGDWDKIFMPFYYLTIHNSSDRYDGMGISLAISKKIMLMMGGDILVGEPDLPRFKTQFTIMVPMTRSVIKRELNISPSASDLTAPPPSPISIFGIASSDNKHTNLPTKQVVAINQPSTINLYPFLMGNTKMEILILDDNIANTQLTSQILSKILNNYNIPSQIDILNDSRQAINKIIFNKYNIIFLDIKMPFISGIEIGRAHV